MSALLEYKEYLILLGGLMAGFLLGRWSSGQPSQDVGIPRPPEPQAGSMNLLINGNNVQVDPVVMAEIQGLIAREKKLEAIKRLREATGLNLAAAKSVVESLEKVVK